MAREFTGASPPCQRGFAYGRMTGIYATAPGKQASSVARVSITALNAATTARWRRSTTLAG
jgi:hypothetical protein